ncbi:MAG: bacterial transcriptional activator domain-containing protein [Myxococcota bacterium]|nr:bacterial transcriptional activator domain-containing protein [Myxococcota bacterium]
MKRPTIQSPLCDGLVRGRLSIAEICGLEQAELDALCELGAEKLELGLIPESLSVFAGLIALYPFDARFWRCYAIALHHGGHLNEAQRACEAALLLEPNASSAQRHLRSLAEAQVPEPFNSSPETHDETPHFSLSNGEPLPLNPSTFPAPEAPIPAPAPEPTVIAAPPLRSEEITEVTERPASPLREVTQTAIVRRRPQAPRAPHRREGTQTAIIRRSRGHCVIEAAADESLDTFFEAGDEETSDA